MDRSRYGMVKNVIRPALFLTAVAVATVTVGVSSPIVRAQEIFRSAVDLVTIQASGRDQKGRIIQGLTSADFEVRDNGQVQRVVEMRADRQSAVTVAILVDMSGSMKVSSKIAMARQVFRSMQLLLKNDDAVAL